MTSAVFQKKMLVVSGILAVFFTYRDKSVKPNISRNFFPASRNLKKKSAGVYVICDIEWQARRYIIPRYL